MKNYKLSFQIMNFIVLFSVLISQIFFTTEILNQFIHLFSELSFQFDYSNQL